MDADVLQRAGLGGLILALGIAMSQANAACPPLLEGSMPALMDDRPQPLCQHAGKVILVVNTASQCGYTPQYDGLEKLYRKYKDRGLVVLGFPSNDFGGQEPGSAREIAKFCELNYGVSFPMFAKTSVAQGKANPFYERLAQASGSRPRWNFHKYLIDRTGATAQAFDTKVSPQDPKLVAEIERLLGK